MRVKGTIGGVTTVYIAGVYEYQAGATTLYYEGNAIRRTGYASNNGVTYLLQDHLKSSSALINQNGTVNGSRNYFLPFGGNRGGTAFNDTTTKRFTGQYHEKDLPGGEGLSYYGARWYDAKLGRFLSADSIVPGAGNPQALNRYSYVLNQPTRMVDPSGHIPQISAGLAGGSGSTQTSSSAIVVTGANGGGHTTTSSVGSSIVGTGRYIHTAYGAEIDMEHFGGGMIYGKLILDTLSQGQDSVVIQKNLRAGYGMVMSYRILKPVSTDQIESIAMAIYFDAEHDFEDWQRTFLMPGFFTETLNGSGYSNEDLVSDYLGFYAAARYPELNAEQAIELIVGQLGGGVRNDTLGPHAYQWPNGHFSGDWRSKNSQTTPRIYISSTDTWMNVEWPQNFRVTPARNDGYWVQDSSEVAWPNPGTVWEWLVNR